MEAVILILMNVGVGFLIAHFSGSKRKIGFGWSLFFCICFSPIIGGIITMLSPKVFDDNTNN
jgi:predicted phage tail protein